MKFRNKALLKSTSEIHIPHVVTYHGTFPVIVLTGKIKQTETRHIVYNDRLGELEVITEAEMELRGYVDVYEKVK